LPVGIGARIGVLSDLPGWPPAVAAHAAPPDDVVPAALDVLTDAAVSGYLRRGHGNPVLLVHTVTAPRAARLVLPALPVPLWRATYDAAWAVTAALTAAYRPHDPAPGAHTGAGAGAGAGDPAQVAGRAVAHGDEHVLKFTEVAIESHHRGNADALGAAARATRMITTEK
jgi:hypothetical protein